ncbi:hypothetical protein DSO57_1002150 [Entomophthora muscae]|uniref:Uncharacterized protein n=1 Tax=Entomophthora muscae TaxID=34485 RepID=A0ACC2SM55_9FUNG|nr:hypothetical protein DSO57_1002150 [Entomophthora muscae]
MFDLIFYLCVFPCTFSRLINSNRPLTTMKAKTNPLPGVYYIPKGYKWAGENANFTAIHLINPKLLKSRATHTRDGHAEYYNLVQVSLYVLYERANISLDYKNRYSDTIRLKYPKKTLASIGIDELNAQGPLDLLNEPRKTNFKTECGVGALFKRDYWSSNVRGVVHTVHLEANFKSYIYNDEDEISITGQKVVRLPIRLENGQCDVYFGSDFQEPADTLYD